ncbi:MAG TPA: hypothetical protein VJ772_06440 [Nitrososphaeraceae archaeon]|nr:hypothetical protein [Nitrososphaeraceae archaeon]
MKGWNLIGFNFPNSSMIDPSKWKKCLVHPGTRLISNPDEPGLLMCPLCGTSYQPNHTISDENFEPTANAKSQTKIFTAKSKKKYYDKQGNEINDEQLLKDMASGKTVISYHEYKMEEGQ